MKQQKKKEGKERVRYKRGERMKKREEKRRDKKGRKGEERKEDHVIIRMNRVGSIKLKVE